MLVGLIHRPSFQPKPRKWRWTSWKKPRRSGQRWVSADTIGLFYLACGFVFWLDGRQVFTSSSLSTFPWHAATANVTDMIISKFGFCFTLFFSWFVAFCNVARPCCGCKVISCPRNRGMWLGKHAASSVAARGQLLHPQEIKLLTWVIVSVATAPFVSHSAINCCVQLVGSLASLTQQVLQFEQSEKVAQN